MCFYKSPELVYLQQNEPFPTLKGMICRKYSCQTLNKFSQTNNQLDAPDSKTDDFLLRDTCVSSS
jgi:hypothetical protein